MRSISIYVLFIIYFNFHIIFMSCFSTGRFKKAKEHPLSFNYTKLAHLVTKKQSLSLNYSKIEHLKSSKQSEPFFRTGGIFQTFLKNLVFTLVNFPYPDFSDKDHQRLKKYFKVLYQCVRIHSYSATRKLANKLKELSQCDENEIKEELNQYKKELDDEQPYRVKFLNAMDSIFYIEDKVRFDDYIYELRNYASLNRLLIEKETTDILKLIMKRIHSLNRRNRRALDAAMRKAMREYGLRSFSSYSGSSGTSSFDTSSTEDSSCSSDCSSSSFSSSSSSVERIVDYRSTSDYSFETWARENKQEWRAKET